MRTTLALVPLLAVVACGGTQPARELSRETLVHVVDYEEQIREMSRILAATSRQADADYAEDLVNTKQIGDIRIEANRANDAADSTLKDGFSDAALRTYVTAVLGEQAALAQRLAELLAKEAAARNAAVAATRQDEAALQAARTKLELLQREPSLRDRAQQLAPLIEAGFRAAMGSTGDQP